MAFELDGFNRPIETELQNTLLENFDRPIKSTEVSDPTRETYFDWAYGFDFFNTELFDGELTRPLITYQRSRKFYGYVAFDRFFPRGRQNAERVAELAMNPMFMPERPDKVVLSTLVHEMAHLKRWLIEPRPTSSYHDTKWASIMIDVGLMPESIDAPGKTTGYKVTHRIIAGGRFDVAADELLKQGFSIRYVEHQVASAPPAGGPVGGAEADGDNSNGDTGAGPALRRARSAASKGRFSCVGCKPAQNAWAKPTAHLICGNCTKRMVSVSPPHSNPFTSEGDTP